MFLFFIVINFNFIQKIVYLKSIQSLNTGLNIRIGMLISNNISERISFTNSAGAIPIAINDVYKNNILPPSSNIR